MFLWNSLKKASKEVVWLHCVYKETNTVLIIQTTKNEIFVEHVDILSLSWDKKWMNTMNNLITVHSLID